MGAGVNDGKTWQCWLTVSRYHMREWIKRHGLIRRGGGYCWIIRGLSLHTRVISWNKTSERHAATGKLSMIRNLSFFYLIICLQDHILKCFVPFGQLTQFFLYPLKKNILSYQHIDTVYVAECPLLRPVITYIRALTNGCFLFCLKINNKKFLSY